MINISANTLINGTSHLVEKHNRKAHVMTDEGKEFFERKLKLYQKSVDTKSTKMYNDFLHQEFDEINRELSVFLRDDDMIKKFKMNDDDKEGWHIFHVLSDKYNVIKFFLEK